MDRFCLKKAPPIENNDVTQWELGLRVYINDRLLDEEDYCLDIDSFFRALDRDGSITLVGGCGIPECCAVGPQSRITKNGWEWRYGIDALYSIGWNDIYKAAETIIQEIEQQDNEHLQRYFGPQLPAYREKRNNLKKLAADLG
ncbi:MAG: hypothetical protein K2X77_06215 [Candidatus Obscuribacterales bacterium]|jgi:hypothetical protein|nr:hypothetical protein [Candidatus Obscuribacterales bacterium]